MLKDKFSKKSNKVLSKTSIEDVGNETESSKYVHAKVQDAKRYIPDIDFSQMENFVKFGSAAKYYEDAIDNIYKTYPYDGSLYEKLEWANSSSNFQNYFFEKEYPRTTGYIHLGRNYGTDSTSSNGYGNPSTQEYILFYGSMNHVTSSGTKLKNLFDTSNIYDSSKNRDYNLQLDGNTGATVEFLFKREDISGSTKQVIFDLWNSASFSSGKYGRFRIEAQPSVDNDKLFLEIMSGSDGIFSTSIGSNLNITGSGWAHYALAFANSGSVLEVELYKNGILNQTFTTGSDIGLVTGSMVATIGSLVTSVSGTDGGISWGKLSGSMDEFRYWKTKRTDKEIRRNYFKQVGGGTNTDDANTDLGVYFKFNEGVYSSGSAHVKDQTVLDYSGRVSNGFWYGYSLGSRNTGSAFISGALANKEFEDPIIYSTHPSVAGLKTLKILTGSMYDDQNNAALKNSLPSWILEEDNGSLNNLTQIMGEYFDDLYLKLQQLPKLKEAKYRSGKKPLPFASKLLEGYGFVAPELFADVTALEGILSRNEDKEFEEKVHDVRNEIYQNIYNNLPYIYRSKGTEKSIRNLVRCFGIDEDVINLAVYADNTDYLLEDRYSYTTKRKKYVDFNDVDRFDSTVYQMTSSVYPESVSYISGNIKHGYTGITLQSEIIAPKKFNKGSPLFFATDFITASIMGIHEADPNNPGKTTWYGSDKADLRVYLVRPEEESKDAYFLLTSSYQALNLTSSLISDIYNNEKWNIAVSFYHSNYPFAGGTAGASSGSYIFKFHGVNTYLDIIKNEFILTQSVSQTAGEEFAAAAKRIYAGAHRTNFTGSLVVGTGNTDEFSDLKISSVRYWLNNVTESVIREHAKDVYNKGSEYPYANSKPSHFLNLSGGIAPEIKTLALEWDFDNVTGSDNGTGLPPSNSSDAGFLVEDTTSGSVNTGSFGWLGEVTQRMYTGKGDFFLRNSTDVIQREYVQSAERKLPETLNNADLVNILSQDDDIFTRDSQPLNHYFAIEKSMYQTISKEMLKFFGTIRTFNNLIGEPVNRYKQEYTDLKYLRTLFFDQIDNVPNFEKYIEYYKWIDDAVNQMIEQLIPASAEFNNTGVSNIIESHILERNKYWNKLPTLELKREPPVGPAKSVGELLYNWKAGHAPISLNENENCIWWKEKAERNTKTGNDLNSSREKILDVTLQTLNRSFSRAYNISSDVVVKIDAQPRDNRYVKQLTSFGTNEYLSISSSEVLEEKDCVDE